MKREVIYTALASRVIAVAVVNSTEKELFDWACYIDSVAGINHDDEYNKVAQVGEKQAERIAHVIFPQLDIKKYRG